MNMAETAGTTGTAGAALTEALAADIDRLLSAEPDVRADNDDSVHQMRVATRRLRSVLRSAKRLLDADAATETRAELAWLADVLGEARDAEVRAERFAALLDDFREETETGSAPANGLQPATQRLLDGERRHYNTAHAHVLSALDEARYHALRERLSRWRTSPPLRSSQATRPAPKLFRAMLQRDQKRLDRLVLEQTTVPPAEQVEKLHDIRKAAKRLRYGCAAAEPVLGTAARRLGKQAKRVQTVLGDHRDAVESRAVILERADEARAAGEDAAVFEVFADAEQEAARRALSGYPAAAEALPERLDVRKD